MSKFAIFFCVLVALSATQGLNLFNRKKEKLEKSQAAIDNKLQKAIDSVVAINKRTKETSLTINNAVKEAVSQLNKEFREPIKADLKRVMKDIEQEKKKSKGVDITECLEITDEMLENVNKSLEDFDSCIDSRTKEMNEYEESTHQITDATFKALTDMQGETGKCMDLYTRIMTFHKAAACLKKIDIRASKLPDKDIFNYEKDMVKILNKLRTIKPSLEKCKNMSKLEITELKMKINCALNEFKVCVVNKKEEAMETANKDKEDSDSTMPPVETSSSKPKKRSN